MLLKMLKSKLHQATVTESRLGYSGSIEIDSSLMTAAGILSYESVLIADITNGVRLQTYVVPGKADSGDIIILGAAAHLIKPKDRIIIFAFAYCDIDEAEKIKPKIIILDENNKITQRVET